MYGFSMSATVTALEPERLTFVLSEAKFWL
jgi:hypothetical protein